MDTFDTTEEVVSEVDIEATEVDFDENFEYGVNDQEHENNNEQEAGIDGEKGEKNTEDEKLEEKEETLSDFITANRYAGDEEFKLEYEGTFVLATLTEEQKLAQANLLTTLTANPEQSIMLPDYIEGKTAYFTAAKMDNEGNLKYEIRSFTNKEEEKEEKPIDKVEGAKLEEATLNLELSIDIDKQEEVDKETLLEQSLLTEIEAVREEDAEQTQEITQSEEQSFSTPEVHHADVEQVISVEETQSSLTPVGEYVNIDDTHHGEQVVIEAKEDTEKAITERIIDLLKEEPQAEFIEEASTVVGITETEQSLKDTHEHIEPLVVTVEDKTEKVLTLEDRIRELFRDEVEPTEIVSEQVQTFEVLNTQQEEIVTDTNETAKINTTTEIVAETEITLPFTHNTEISEPVVNEILNTTTERSVLSNEQVEQIVAHVEVEVVGNQAEIHETVQASHIENIQQQRTEVEQTFSTEKMEVDVGGEKPEEVVLVNEQENKISNTTEQTVTKEVTTDIEVESLEHATIEEIKAEEGIVEKVQNSDVVIEAVAAMPQEISKTETILSEVVSEAHVVEDKNVKIESNEVQEVAVNNIQTQGIEKTETVSYIADSDKSETQNVVSINIENTKEEKADQNKESFVVTKSEKKIVVETKVKDIKPIVVEKVDTRKEVTKSPDANREKAVAKNQEERTPKSSREAIVLRFNKNTINNTTRNEAAISLEKPKEEKRTTEESLKAKPLSGHEILLQILGISQNATESRNAEPANSGSVPNINPEEQETELTKSIPSIYQQRNLNGITLKIAA